MTQTVQLALAMDSETGEKIVRIELGDAASLKYTIFEDSYEFALEILEARTAMFSISRDENGIVSGKIYEYLTEDLVEIGSGAEFYISDEYVSVVGNKASGLVGFDGYITELYDAESGRMLGYEIQETLSSIVYNTFWFNLSEIIGIDSVMYVPAEKLDEKPLIFVNGLSKAFETKNIGGLSLKMLSRRFDIEFRTQYV